MSRKTYNVNLVYFMLVFFLGSCIMFFSQYRTDFPSSMKEHAVFVDLAPRFQLLAEEILQRQVHLVIYNLKEVISLLKCMKHLAISY